MSIIKTIGDKIRSLLSSSPNASVDKVTLSTLMESQISTLTGIGNALQTPAVKTRISQILKDKKATGGYAAFKHTYESFYTSLHAQTQVVERKSPFESVRQGITCTLKGLDDLLDNLDTFLGQGADISISDLRVSGMTLIGYTDQISDVIDWCNYMLNYALSDAEDRQAPYVADVLEAITQTTAYWDDQCTFLNRSNKTILSTIEDLAQSSANTNLIAGNHTLDSFVTDKDMPNLTLQTGPTFLRSPSVMISEHIALGKKAKLDNLKSQKEWLQNKVALLQLKMNNVDPESEEYKRLKKVVDNYNDMIVANDRKIKRHETSR